jgi:hypothetical protein
MDLNVHAFRLVQAAITERAPESERRVASRKGGLKGGKARAKAISAEQRSAIARKASAARWRNNKPYDQAEQDGKERGQ